MARPSKYTPEFRRRAHEEVPLGAEMNWST